MYHSTNVWYSVYYEQEIYVSQYQPLYEEDIYELYVHETRKSKNCNNT